MVFKSKTQGKFRIYLRDNESLLQDEVPHKFKKSEGKYALDAFLQELNLTYTNFHLMDMLLRQLLLKCLQV